MISISGSSGIDETAQGTVAAHGPLGAAGARRRSAARAERELEALVGVSSPSGRRPRRRGVRRGVRRAAARRGRDRARAVLLARPRARTSSRGCAAPAPRRVLLLGHVDTVVAHDDHKPLARDGDKLVGSGAVDMKGGVVLALGAMRALAQRAGALRRGRAAARLRRGVADGAVRPRRPLRRLGRVPVLRGRRAARPTATRAWSCGARPRGRSASPRAAAPPTPARRRTAAATRCSRSPRPRRPSPLPRPGRARTG